MTSPAAQEHRTGIALAGLERERPLPVDTPWGSFALMEVRGRLVAVESFCPHLLGPLFQGTRSGPEGTELTCPWHAWRYSLVTGACVDSPRDEGARTRIRFLVTRLDARGRIVLLGPPCGEAPLEEAPAFP